MIQPSGGTPQKEGSGMAMKPGYKRTEVGVKAVGLCALPALGVPCGRRDI